MYMYIYMYIYVYVRIWQLLIGMIERNQVMRSCPDFSCIVASDVQGGPIRARSMRAQWAHKCPVHEGSWGPQVTGPQEKAPQGPMAWQRGQGSRP